MIKFRVLGWMMVIGLLATAVAQRLATIIICLHPIFVELRSAVTAMYLP